MKKLIASIFLVIFIILTTLNIIFFIEITQNKDLKEFYLGNELPDNYSEKEKIHLQEVKALTNLSLLLNLISLGIVLSLKNPNIKKTGNSLIIISILLFIGALSFQTFFRHFHLLFFNSNNWLLPSSSTLIQTYPLDFFRNRFLIFILIIGFVLSSYRLTLKRFLQKPQRKS